MMYFQRDNIANNNANTPLFLYGQLFLLNHGFETEIFFIENSFYKEETHPP